MEEKIDPQTPQQNQIQSEINTSNSVELNSLTSMNYFMTDLLSTGVSQEQLKLYVKYPMTYNKQLRQISLESYNSNGLLANTVDYMVAIPNLDSVITSFDKSAGIKKKKIAFKEIFNKINHKLTTRDILRHQLIDGMYVGIVRNTTEINKDIDLGIGSIDSLTYVEGLAYDSNLMIQPLNLDWCKVIGYQNNVQVAAFNMMYFEQFKHGGLISEIKNFPTEFATAYLDYKKDASKQWFKLNPKTTIVRKFKSTISEPYGRPLAISALSDIQFASDYNDSQHATVNDLASSIYYMTLPEGEKKGACSLGKEQQKTMVSAFEGAISQSSSMSGNSRIKVSKLTLAPGTTINRMAKDSSLLKDTLSGENMNKVSTGLGFASAALNASSQGGASYSSLQVNIDLVMSQIFEELEQIAIEYSRVLNGLVDNKGRESINITYLRTTQLNKDNMVASAKDLYTLGSGSLRYWVACTGTDPDVYLSMMEDELLEGIYDRYLPHQSSYTANNETFDKGGAPSIDKPTNDNTIKSKTSGSNIQPKPSTK